MVRDEKGRFVEGNPGGGRKRRSDEENIKALIDRAVSQKDWIEIFEKARDQAKRGDSTARAFLADRRFGKALQPVEHSGEDGGPIEHKVATDETIGEILRKLAGLANDTGAACISQEPIGE